jgi:hypothetical protein
MNEDRDFVDEYHAVNPYIMIQPKKEKSKTTLTIVITVSITLSLSIGGGILYLWASNLAEYNTDGDLSLPRPTPIYTGVSALITLESYTVDYGEDRTRLDYEVYWDDDNTGVFESGQICSAWEYYRNSDANIEQTVDKYCREYTEDRPHQVSITACLYDAEDNQYDIHFGDDEWGSCVIWRNIDIEPSFESWRASCSGTQSGEYLSGLRTFSASGLDDSDSNEYNGKVDFTIQLEYAYDCVFDEE